MNALVQAPVFSEGSPQRKAKYLDVREASLLQGDTIDKLGNMVRSANFNITMLEEALRIINLIPRRVFPQEVSKNDTWVNQFNGFVMGGVE